MILPTVSCLCEAAVVVECVGAYAGRCVLHNPGPGSCCVLGGGNYLPTIRCIALTPSLSLPLFPALVSHWPFSTSSAHHSSLPSVTDNYDHLVSVLSIYTGNSVGPIYGPIQLTLCTSDSLGGSMPVLRSWTYLVVLIITTFLCMDHVICCG